MPTCPRCAFPALAVAFLAFTGCDSNGATRDLELVEGAYEVAELSFQPNATSIAPVDLAADLDLTVTRLQIFGADTEALFVTKFRDSGSRRTNLTVSASRGRASFRGLTPDDEAELADVFLPSQFDLTYDQSRPGRLEGTFSQTVNLEAFDAQRYSGLRSVPGRLMVRLVRL